MGNAITELFSNRVLIPALVSWAVAQVIKTILYAIVHKEISLDRLFGDGGFPSGHSATVTALAISTAFIYGLGSFEFAVTAILAIVVMHDAMGVRLETGKQAKIINDIVEFFDKAGSDLTDEEKLKELVGHTPLQVIAGFLLGVVVAFLMRPVA